MTVTTRLRRIARSSAIVTIGGLTLFGHLASAADATPPAPPAFLPGPLVDDDTGFALIFDGKSLAGWDGDPALWHVEDSAIVGEVDDRTSLKSETFLVWRGGEPGNFELKADYRISDLGNSGLQYRSSEKPGAKWSFDSGNQLDIDGRAWGEGFNARVLSKNGVDCPRITGLNVGRVVFALPGQVTVVSDRQTRRVVGSLGSCTTVAQAIGDGWNKLHLIVRDGLMVHIVNGQVLSIVIDDDAARVTRGKLGLQLHAGGPMKVEFRNIRLKTFDGN